MSTINYTVEGEPISVVTVLETDSPQIWNTYKQLKFNYRQCIKNQHNYRQYMDGPIKLDIIFYMKFTRNNPKKGLHESLPPIVHLFNFVDQALKGIAYRKDCTISKVSMTKIYDKKPRTEITLSRL